MVKSRLDALIPPGGGIEIRAEEGEKGVSIMVGLEDAKRFLDVLAFQIKRLERLKA